jgi:hypothetical protein
LMNARALIETIAGNRSLVAWAIGTAITADYLTRAITTARSRPQRSRRSCLG